MLEGLDRVDWTLLTHAYGEASDVPALLRALVSPRESDREWAVYDLFGNVWHQCTVYSATAAAVPFLYELLADSEVPGKTEIACLLASIARGRGYLEVHRAGELGKPIWRKTLGDSGRTIEEELKEELEREAAEIRSVRQAVSVGLSCLLPYLQDQDAEVREVVARAFVNYPEHTAQTLPALQAALPVEGDEEVRDALNKSIEGLTSEAPPGDRRREE